MTNTSTRETGSTDSLGVVPAPPAAKRRNFYSKAYKKRQHEAARLVALAVSVCQS